MRWPPNKAWTSAAEKKGFRHFEVKDFGGKGDDRWVELIAILDKDISIRVTWNELKTYSKWTTGWLRLPKEDI